MKRRVSVKKKCCGYFLQFLSGRCGASPKVSEQTDVVAESRAKKIAFVVIIRKRMGNYLLKELLQMQSTGASSFTFS